MKLSSRDRRALWLGALAAIAIVGYAGAVRPLLRAATALEQRKEALVELRARSEELLAAAPIYRAAAESAEVQLARLRPETLSGDPQAAVNRLLAILERAASGSSVRILRANPVPIDSAGPGLSRIGASLEGESDLAGLLLLLHSLETAGPLFHVSGLRVEAPGGGDGEVEVLRFGFTVRAFVLAGIRKKGTPEQRDHAPASAE